MAAKTDKKPVNPLPVNTDDLTPSSNITYNNEVVAIIAGLAANEVEGIAGMCTVSSGLKNNTQPTVSIPQYKANSRQIRLPIRKVA